MNKHSQRGAAIGLWQFVTGKIRQIAYDFRQWGSD
jgi:hypothetical protein